MRNIRVSEIMGGWKREVERVEERGRKLGRDRYRKGERER